VGVVGVFGGNPNTLGLVEKLVTVRSGAASARNKRCGKRECGNG
jgi:hypothetical protein